MRVKDAIVCRLQMLCEARQMRYNELAVRAGVTPSTVYSLMNEERQDVSVSTVKKLCDGLDISIADFFDADIFRDLEQEIQ
ncbi:MAG: XRE family transcriptional regulator [Clostridia bacterium]|nr:MAG: XRE family transcriptional regulator [Clostridia bacterium]